MNKQLLLIIALLLALPSMAAKKAQKPTLIITDLRTERMVNPMSIDTPTPRLGWRLESTEQNVVQTAYHIIVASSREKAEALEGDLWDVTVESDQSQWVRYEGKPLKSNTRCYWRVQVKPSRPTPQPLPTGRGVDSSSAGFSVDKTNYAPPSEGGDGGGSAGFSPWSDIAMWNVGLLTESDWRGRWIGLDRAMPWDREEEHSRLSARYLRTEFQVDKPVRQATLYISGLGLKHPTTGEKLTLAATSDGYYQSGTYYEYVMEVINEAVNRYNRYNNASISAYSTTDASALSAFAKDNKTATKGLGAFDNYTKSRTSAGTNCSTPTAHSPTLTSTSQGLSAPMHHRTRAISTQTLPR